MRTHGSGNAFGMGNQRAAVADNGDESQGRDACMDHLDRSRARIDRSVCAPRAARTCPRTWTIVETKLSGIMHTEMDRESRNNRRDLLIESKLFPWETK